MIPRSQIESAVIEFFRTCHRDLDPVEIEREVNARVERLKVKDAEKKARTKPKGDFLGSYLRNKHRM